jgi:hypothetical protein
LVAALDSPLDHFLGDIVPLAVAGARAEVELMRTGQTVGESTSLANVHSRGSRPLSALSGTWGPRVLWLAVAITGAWSIGDALDGRSAALRTTVTIGAWLVWGTGVVALVVPSTLGLTAMRMICALACGAAAVAWVGGASPTAGALSVMTSAICGLLVGSADFGQRCVQASSYGDEQRFLLRPPAAFVPPIAVAGVVWVAATLAAPLLLATRQWATGVATAVGAVLLTWLLLPRFNALSRRWLVLVPAGVVVHDQVVLAETLMVSRSDLVGIDLALDDTEAADFTGPASGHAVEIRMRSMVTALLAPGKDTPRGKALHVQSFIVAPSRPGAVLRSTQPR